MVQISYRKLFKKLIDLDLNKTKLRSLTGIGTGTLAKLSKGEKVSMEILAKICVALTCSIEDIVEFNYEKK